MVYLHKAKKTFNTEDFGVKFSTWNQGPTILHLKSATDSFLKQCWSLKANVHTHTYLPLKTKWTHTQK